MENLDDAAAFLERLTGGPLADSVHAAVRVVSATEPVGRSRFQECSVVVVPLGEGLPEEPATLDVVVDRRHWPIAGQVLPARVSRSHPGAVDVDWDALAR